MLTIQHTTMADIEAAPELPALMTEYEAECANPEIGKINPQWPTYRAMEAAGILKAISATFDGKLIGFALMLLPVLPHFGLKVAVSESLFVAAKYRNTGAGNKLLKAAEDLATAENAVGVLVSAPVGGRLWCVMSRSESYVQSSAVFFKALK